LRFNPDIETIGWLARVRGPDARGARMQKRKAALQDKPDHQGSVRAALAHRNDVSEVRMFAGMGFLINGNLVAAASVRGLLLRLGETQSAKALKGASARPLVMRGKALKDYVYVDPPFLDDRAVKAWLKLAAAFVETLPPKRRQAKAGRRMKRKA
jgi:TfoX/Sxy family transcriptional regulator of competence genes